MRDVRVLLIGGTSHVGKTTLAKELAGRLGWHRRSTDGMARHPGRPWGTVKDHLTHHYRSLSVDELTTAQYQHYERLWPAVEQVVEAHASDPAAERLVLEGSGILPARVAARVFPNTAAFWLVADAATLRTRVHAVSGFECRNADEKLVVEKFLGRTTRYNDVLMEGVRRWGLRGIDVGVGRSVDELVEQILALLR